MRLAMGSALRSGIRDMQRRRPHGFWNICSGRKECGRYISDMKQYIAYCGLDCESCEARRATVNNDDSLRRKVAKEWSELNGVEITQEMINCVGCRIDGIKTPYCESLCPIRQCAMGRGMETCGSCGEMESCGKLGVIAENNAEALQNLRAERGERYAIS